MSNFCPYTGKYLAAPEKPVKKVPFVSIGRNTGRVYLCDDWCRTFACAALVRVVFSDEGRLIVETTNSVYVGKPA